MRTPGHSTRIPGLRGDVYMARQLFDGPRSSEKEARAAARRVLNAVAHLLFIINEKFHGKNDILGEPMLLGLFLAELGPLFDPQPTDNSNQSYARKVVFTDITQGAGSAQAARPRRLAIALRVRELQKAKQKGAVRITAEEFDTVSAVVSRICSDQSVKKDLDLEDFIDRVSALWRHD